MMWYRYHRCGYPIPVASQSMGNNAGQEAAARSCPGCRRAFADAELVAERPDPSLLVRQWTTLWPGVRQQLEARLDERAALAAGAVADADAMVRAFERALQRLSTVVDRLRQLPVVVNSADFQARDSVTQTPEAVTQRALLVPLDGSAEAESALPHAVRIAQAAGWAIMLVRVVHDPTVYAGLAGPYALEIDPLPFWEAEVQAARSYLDQTAGLLRERGIQVAEMVLDGDPATALLGWIPQNPSIAMIVMASHGRSGLRRLVFGSVAEKVLHAAPVPLLLVRAHEPPTHAADVVYRTIIVPLDGSVRAEQALAEAQRLARHTSAALVLLHVVPTPGDLVLARQGYGTAWDAERLATRYAQAEAYLQATASAVAATGIAVRTLVHDGHAGDQIVMAAEEANADLIVMGTHGLTGLRRLWLGSMATHVVRHSAIPVLLVREGSQPADGERIVPGEERSREGKESAPGGQGSSPARR